MKKTTWFLFSLLFAVSCLDEPECYLLNNNIVGIYFRVMGSNQIDSLGIRKLLINGLPNVANTGWDLPRDSVLTHIQVPLDFFTTSTNYTIGTHTTASGPIDRTITLGYKVQAQFVSEDCGPRYILSDLDVLTSGFDSVRVVNHEPTRDGTARHIEIFRCPATDTLTLTLNQLTLPATPSGARSRVASRNLNSITVDNTTPLYENQRATTIHLPVNLEAETTSYTFDFASGFEPTPVRTLTVNYTTTTETRYRQCGPQTFVTGLQVAEGYTFDSVSIARDPNGFPLSTLTDPFQNNINVYSCPPTNILQLAFRRRVAGSTSTTAATVAIERVTTNYTAEVFYEGVSASVIQLPLDLNANSTVFTIEMGDGVTETLTVNYITGPPSSSIFKPQFKCGNIRVVSGITVSGATGTTTVPNASVLFPPVNNITLEVP